MAVSDAPLTAGVELGKYEIVRRLAVGGMAELYLARARGIEGWSKPVVLKRILPAHAEDEEFVRMFLDEARLAARLHHPNVAQVYDIGLVEGSTPFFSMEYVAGEDVHHILRAAKTTGLGLPLPQALTIVLGVAAGLHHAHEARGEDGQPLCIVHRDVSPSNVLVSWEGAVKVVDFGIAKAANQQIATRTGTLKGKIPYMSPEQCRGLPLDRRADVFSLGILLYELTCGVRPFRGETELALLQLISGEDAAPPSTRRPDYPPALEAVVLRALQRDRDRRYQTAQELQLALEAYACENKLSTSSVALAAHMAQLFGDRTSESPPPTPVGAEQPPTAILAARPFETGAATIPTPTPVPGSLHRRRRATVAAVVVVAAAVVTAAALWSAGIGGSGGTDSAAPASPPPTTGAIAAPAPPPSAEPPGETGQPATPPAPAADPPRKEQPVRAKPPRGRPRGASSTEKPAEEPRPDNWNPDSPFLP